MAEAVLVGVGAPVSGMHGTLPCFSEPNPHPACCLEGDVSVPLTGWVFVFM